MTYDYYVLPPSISNPICTGYNMYCPRCRSTGFKRRVTRVRDFMNRQSPWIVAVCACGSFLVALAVAFGLPAMLLALLI